jgi:hypothetical protein
MNLPAQAMVQFGPTGSPGARRTVLYLTCRPAQGLLSNDPRLRHFSLGIIRRIYVAAAAIFARASLSYNLDNLGSGALRRINTEDYDEESIIFAKPKNLPG